jgi:methionyl aminopeptidase
MIVLKSAREIEKMKKSGQIVARILQQLKAKVRPGVTTLELDQLAEKLIKENNVLPAFKGYKGFKHCICASVNQEVVHGIPSEKRVLQEGDLFSADFGVIYEGYYGDSAFTVAVGKINSEYQKLVKVTEESLYKGIDQIKIGNHLSDISHAVQTHVEKHGFSVVREFVGHGIGQALHEDPPIPNYGEPHQGPVLKEGMVLAVEPMVNIGRPSVTILDDGWTAVTTDGSMSAHFEHTIAVTANGPDILTKL